MAPFRFQHATVLAKASYSQQMKHQNAKEMKKMKSSMRHLQAEMREISEEQKSIREGQRQVREKFDAIESECQKLHQETKLITQQSAISRYRLTLMFQILKARQNNDFSTATALTQALRKIKRRLRNAGSGVLDEEGEGIKFNSTQKWILALV